jgi:hypothetical protein
VNRRGFFAAVATIPGIVTAKREGTELPHMASRFMDIALYGKFAEPTPNELLQYMKYKRHNAEIMRWAHDADIPTGDWINSIARRAYFASRVEVIRSGARRSPGLIHKLCG